MSSSLKVKHLAIIVILLVIICVGTLSTLGLTLMQKPETTTLVSTSISTIIQTSTIVLTETTTSTTTIYQGSAGFAIYLSENNELVISDRDIMFYNKTSHQIKLNEEGIDRIKKFDYFTTVYHKSFVVKLNGKEMYNGSFWSDVDSMPYSGVAIVDLRAIQGGMTDIIRIERCYPPQFCKGVDPRDNSEIFDYFQRIGKLVE